MSQLISLTNPHAFLNELVSPLHDNCGMFNQFSFQNKSFNLVQIPGYTCSGMTSSGPNFSWYNVNEYRSLIWNQNEVIPE